MEIIHTYVRSKGFCVHKQTFQKKFCSKIILTENLLVQHQLSINSKSLRYKLKLVLPRVSSASCGVLTLNDQTMNV